MGRKEPADEERQRQEQQEERGREIKHGVPGERRRGPRGQDPAGPLRRGRDGRRDSSGSGASNLPQEAQLAEHPLGGRQAGEPGEFRLEIEARAADEGRADELEEEEREEKAQPEGHQRLGPAEGGEGHGQARGMQVSERIEGGHGPAPRGRFRRQTARR
ncbi:hypothetical protein A3858_21695 (plasmid) [Cereibacter sphaeroides]|nr:hypothetical protein A3858_21695 [Cereibacter sphaeroides]